MPRQNNVYHLYARTNRGDPYAQRLVAMRRTQYLSTTADFIVESERLGWQLERITFDPSPGNVMVIRSGQCSECGAQWEARTSVPGGSYKIMYVSREAWQSAYKVLLRWAYDARCRKCYPSEHLGG